MARDRRVFHCQLRHERSPGLMSFAVGGDDLFVEEEILESHRSPNRDLATLAEFAGFVVIMILDLAFR